jgi:hypothetical protein
MHMITAGIGGTGTKNNLVPAPTSVNSGSTVRGFETSVEALVKRENARTKRPNVIWVRVTSTGYHPGFDDPIRNISYDNETYVKSIRFQAGIFFPGQDPTPDDKTDWIKDTTSVLDEKTSVPAPNFKGLPVDLNTVGRVYIERVTRVSSHFAREIADRRDQNAPDVWGGLREFVADMKEKRKEENREVTEEFLEALETVKKSHAAKLFRFGD